MNNNEYKERFREYEKINASSELKNRIISIASQKTGSGDAARKIVIAGSVAAAVLICTAALCTISIFNKSSRDNGITAETSIEVNKVISETEPETDSIKTVLADPKETETVSEVPKEQEAEPRELKMVLSDNTVNTGNNIDTRIYDNYDPVITEPVYNNVEEQPVARAADAGTTFENMYPEYAYSEEADHYQDDIIWGEPAEAADDEITNYISANEEPGWEKDNDTQALQVDYDPMIFNDKERAIYENCAHEWVTVVWPVPGATEHIECSKCGVMLNMWLYNGYTK